MGWFDGNPTSLGALAPEEEAERVIRLAGGVEAVWAEIGKARTDNDFQWALQLLDRLIQLKAEAGRARLAKAEVLREHAVNQINCPTRHYYIQSAKELEQQTGEQGGGV